MASFQTDMLLTKELEFSVACDMSYILEMSVLESLSQFIEIQTKMLCWNYHWTRGEKISSMFV